MSLVDPIPDWEDNTNPTPRVLVPATNAVCGECGLENGYHHRSCTLRDENEQRDLETYMDMSPTIGPDREQNNTRWYPRMLYMTLDQWHKWLDTPEGKFEQYLAERGRRGK